MLRIGFRLYRFIFSVIENHISAIDRLFTDMTITTSRPFVLNPIIQVNNLIFIIV